MRANDLNVSELIEFDSEGGIIRFAGERTLLIDATAKGTLRKELVHHFGLATGRAVLTRFGFVQGWRTADALRSLFHWESDEELHQACARVPMLEGMFSVGSGPVESLMQTGLTLSSSYEAEQHIAHLGRSDGSVCWTICGLMSGSLSRILQQEIYVLEEKCIGRGDPVCHLMGRTLDEWGDERADDLRFYRVQNLQEWLEPSLHQVTESLKRAEQKLKERTRVLSRIVPDVDDPLGLIARSAEMRRLLELARRIARVDATTLITGESGTGKERIAHLIHDESARARGPFIAVNCGAITESLLESELFGHARGSFTGASQDRVGLFEAANGGTLLLDEIGDVSPGMQIKLLRTLQEREIRRVGENKTRPVNVRVVAATNRELKSDIESGRFRKDLYYRLNVVQLHVPALRNRRDDILPLARVLLTDAAARSKRSVTSLSARAADQLLRYDWPGNVRELENAMEHAVALGRSKAVKLEDLPEAVRQAIPRPTLSTAIRPLQDVEKDYIKAVLEQNGGNQAQTARQLGIGSATLYRKLKRYETER